MGKALNLDIIVNGKANGFSQVGAALTSVGSQIEMFGRETRRFLTGSVGVYREYEDSMLDAKGALSAQYGTGTKLVQIMDSLDEHASSWAENSIFHTNDVANAISEASHAGWSYEQILEGIPAAMRIAQAGGLDLSEGLDFLIKMMNSTGTEFKDSGKIIDQWGKAANISATNVGKIGEAFLSLGSAAMFGGSTEELFTMLAVLADVGTTGSQAGTMLRSTMVRLLAPTMKAEQAMSLLGVDADELNTVLADTSVTKAAKTLQGIGFSAYDADGNLLPMLDIFTNLNTLLDGMDEASKNEILSAIFPTRTISSAMAFLEAVGSGKAQAFFEAISNSEGYSDYLAQNAMSGLTGSVELLFSKWEELKKSIGETLAPFIESAAEKLGGLLDKINGLSPESIASLTGMLSALSAIGPLLLGAGAITRIVSTLGVSGTVLVVAAAAAGGLYGYLSKLNELDFESKFGNIQLNLGSLGDSVDGITTIFTDQKKAIEEWETAFDNAFLKYSDKSTELSELLIENVLTGKTLSQGEIDNINKYANELVGAVYSGIENAEARDMSFLEILFAGTEDAAAGSLGGQVVNSYYEGLYAEAEAIGRELRNKFTEALRDGSLDEAERQAIQDTINRHNQIMAEIAAGTETEGYYAQLYKAQTVNFESVADYLAENAEKMESDLASVSENYANEYGRFMRAFDYAVANGTTITDPFTGLERTVTEADREGFTAAFRAKEDEARKSVEQKYLDLANTAIDSLLNQSEFSDAWAFLKTAKEKNIDLSDAEAFASALGTYGPEKGNIILGQLNQMSGSYTLKQFQKAFGVYSGTPYADMLLGAASADTTAGMYSDLFPNFLETAYKNATVPVEMVPNTEAVDDYVPPTKYAAVVYGPYLPRTDEGVPGYAEGGRADAPSIFGEAGPEWAIPEEHSERTANLLDAARQASGFTWGDIISRFGGLSSGENRSVVLQYSPTINASDASGVESVLASDKSRLMRWIKEAFAEQRFRDDVEVYA